MQTVWPETVSAKVEAISTMKPDCSSVTEVRRFLGACAFYYIWIPHYAHITEPLYGLLKKGRRFEWRDEHTESVRKMKEALAAAPTLGKVVYEKGTPIYITVSGYYASACRNEAEPRGS